jgi:CHASE2 domain-containing sensor protein
LDKARAAEVFPIFFAIWVVLGLINVAVLFGPFSGRLKQRFFLVMIVLAGILFAGFTSFMSPGSFFFVVPAVVLITAINLWTIRFCMNCGKVVRSTNPFERPRFCSKCGSSLDRSSE